MATLILTAVGTAIGGPIGGAVGAAVGQQIDQRLFAPAARDGPRLSQLRVQTSSYGASIPYVYGRMRLAGSVIWAMDLREDRQRVSQGKGRPKAIVYSYSASFAVALSARPGQSIGRIWADGQLLRGAAGDFKVATGFRFYSGAEDQPVDPLIAAVEGDGQAPAYRGLCYCVFEDLALEPYGNRIPLLSFELIADAAPVRADMILTDIAARSAAYGPGLDLPIRAHAAAPLTGYAVDAANMREAMAPLIGLLGLDVWDDGAQVQIARPQGAAQMIGPTQLGAQPGAMGGPAKSRMAAARHGLTSALRLGYADPERDYQPSVQQADLFVPGRSVHLDVPAVLDAGTARQRALAALIDRRAEADRLTLSLPWAALPLMAGGRMMVAAESGVWRVQAARFDAMRIVVELSRAPDIAPALPAAEAGRGVPAPDRTAGETRLSLVDLPWLDAGLATRPFIVAAAAGTQPGWRRAVLLQSTDQGATWAEIGATAAPALMGRCADALAPAPPYCIDEGSTLTVDMLHDDMTLTSCDMAALLAGRNLMLVGQELIQFGVADRMGPARYRLSRLLRGRRGTEDRIAGHQPDEEVLLISRDTLVALDLPDGVKEVRVMATGIGDAAPCLRTLAIEGRAVRPLSPVHLAHRWSTDGALMLSWVRRSRDGWGWADGVDAPLAEESEAYRIVVTPDQGAGWTETTTAPVLTLPAPVLARLRAAGARRLDWQVQHIGTAGPSLPSVARLDLM